MSNKKQKKRTTQHRSSGARHTAPAKQTPKQKERGWVLALAIIYVMIHGVLLLGLVIGENSLRNLPIPTWLVLSVAAVAIADIVAGVMLWRWKQLGLTIYFISTLGAVVAGAFLRGGYAFIFAAFLPFLVVGYIVRYNWSKFE